MWYDCQCDPQKLKQQTMIDKTHTIKQAVKVPKIKEVKLFVKDENRPNL